jgi:hypothetical protein
MGYLSPLTSFLTSYVTSIPLLLLDVLIETPLKHLYRHGPLFFGWEGQSLAQICTSITYTGDVNFWQQNIAQCKKIYDAKVIAQLAVYKPVIYVLLLVLFTSVTVPVFVKGLKEKMFPDKKIGRVYDAIRLLGREIGVAGKV